MNIFSEFTRFEQVSPADQICLKIEIIVVNSAVADVHILEICFYLSSVSIFVCQKFLIN